MSALYKAALSLSEPLFPNYHNATTNYRTRDDSCGRVGVSGAAHGSTSLLLIGFSTTNTTTTITTTRLRLKCDGISGSNAGYTKFRSSVKNTGYPLYSPTFPSLPLPCVAACHHISTRLSYTQTENIQNFEKRVAIRCTVRMLCGSVAATHHSPRS